MHYVISVCVKCLLTCFFQFKFSSIVTPRYLADSTGCNFFLHNLKFSFDILVFLLFLKRMTLVFVAFKAILLAFSQKESSFKFLLRVLLILSMEFCLFKTHVSSAKWNGEDNLIALCKSLITKKERA